jgi:Helix-turn-helix domain
VPKRYPEEFRRKVLDLVAAGRPVAQIAADLAVSDQTIYDWRCPRLTAVFRWACGRHSARPVGGGGARVGAPDRLWVRPLGLLTCSIETLTSRLLRRSAAPSSWDRRGASVARP